MSQSDLMQQRYEQLSEALAKLELDALQNPDQLFALSYVRSHLDLLDLEAAEGELTEALAAAASSTFDADQMSVQDRADVLSIIRSLVSL